ncbi:MAG: type II toxin-antitoxin system RelE/ParE family toxin [Clostridia bacterium]|jgi:toxin ParE1/3/4
MKYRIERTDKANDQLYEIINYIADDSGSIEVALSYLDRLEQAIMALGETPHMGSYPRYSILRKQGYRVLIVESHLVFYKADDDAKCVTIYAVVHSRQEYKNLI